MPVLNDRTFDLFALISGNISGLSGFALQGVQVNGGFGWTVAGGTDVTGDGVDDLLIGAQRESYRGADGAGAAYLFEGGDRREGLLVGRDTATVRFEGSQVNAKTGIGVSSISDINGDGTDDLVIGAMFWGTETQPQSGAAYFVHGGTFSGGRVELDALAPSDGVQLNGRAAFDRLGKEVSRLGDMNGDGIDDFALSSHMADPFGRKDAGEVFVIFGGQDFDGVSDLEDLDGLLITGAEEGGRFGRWTASAGDVNGDGKDDLLVGAPLLDSANGANAGAAYVIYGGTDLSGQLDLTDLDDEIGFALFTGRAGDRVGYSVSGAGDINNDGIDDFVVGARTADGKGRVDVGTAYVIFGGQDFAEADRLADLRGIRILGEEAGDQFGFSVAEAGDFNADGIDDLIIGARFADAGGVADAGAAYVILGGQSFSRTIDLANLNTPGGVRGADVLRFEGWLPEQYAGTTVSGVGDIDGDGYDDVAIGAPGAGGGTAIMIYGDEYVLG